MVSFARVESLRGRMGAAQSTRQVEGLSPEGVCFKRVERRNIPKVLPRNFAAFAATFGTVSTEMKHTPPEVDASQFESLLA
jgi:hypothetical protein